MDEFYVISDPIFIGVGHRSDLGIFVLKSLFLVRILRSVRGMVKCSIWIGVGDRG